MAFKVIEVGKNRKPVCDYILVIIIIIIIINEND